MRNNEAVATNFRETRSLKCPAEKVLTDVLWFGLYLRQEHLSFISKSESIKSRCGVRLFLKKTNTVHMLYLLGLIGPEGITQ